ncbi:MAG: signal peptidase I [Chloroflexi bacterium]|nr:signal peptidase I [Chloroflexota bacterium]
MADVAERTRLGRYGGRLLRALALVLLAGGGLAVLLFSLALGFAHWIRSQPEPAVLLLGDSMPPTLQSFDVVYLRAPRDLRRGVIISYRVRHGRIAHRIVGLPGETIAVRDGQVVIGTGGDARPLEETYVRYPFRWSADPVTLAPDEYLTLGDNRAAASGRAIHLVPRQDIVAAVYRIVFPPWRARLLKE